MVKVKCRLIELDNKDEAWVYLANLIGTLNENKKKATNIEEASQIIEEIIKQQKLVPDSHNSLIYLKNNWNKISAPFNVKSGEWGAIEDENVIKKRIGRYINYDPNLIEAWRSYYLDSLLLSQNKLNLSDYVVERYRNLDNSNVASYLLRTHLLEVEIPAYIEKEKKRIKDYEKFKLKFFQSKGEGLEDFIANIFITPRIDGKHYYWDKDFFWKEVRQQIEQVLQSKKEPETQEELSKELQEQWRKIALERENKKYVESFQKETSDNSNSPNLRTSTEDTDNTNSELSLEVIKKIKDFDYDWLTPEQELLVNKLISSEELRKRYKKYGLCPECQQTNTWKDKYNNKYTWCRPCGIKRLQQNFKNWTSGNPEIDQFIQKSQLEASSPYEILEWIPYENFTNIEYLAQGGFGKVYKAQWVEGEDFISSRRDGKWINHGKESFALKSLSNSQDITVEFLHEVTNHKLFKSDYDYVIKCYGISQDPKTKNYLMVMDYMSNGDLRKYLRSNQISFYDKLERLISIIKGLDSIHSKGLVHRDFHAGNILNRGIVCYIADLGLSKPVNKEDKKEKIYGVLPYMAPEVLLHKIHTQASDIYSFGIVAYELFSGLPPYHDLSHERMLALWICSGLRPNLNEFQAPQLLKDLIKKCWEVEPLKRPTTKELKEILCDWCDDIAIEKDTEFSRQYKKIQEAEEFNSAPSSIINSLTYQTHPQAIYTSRLLDFKNLPQPQNSQLINDLFYDSKKNYLLGSLESQLVDGDKEIDDLRTRYSILKKALASFSKEIQEQIKEKEIIELDSEIKKTEIKTQELMVLKTEELIVGAKSDIKKLKKLKEEKEKELSELRNKNQELEKELKEKTTLYRQKEEELKVQRAKAEDLKKEWKEALLESAKKESESAEKKKWEQKANELERKLDETKKKEYKLEGELEWAESEVKYLREQSAKPTQQFIISGGTGVSIATGDNATLSNQLTYHIQYDEKLANKELTELKQKHQTLEPTNKLSSDPQKLKKIILFLASKQIFATTRQDTINGLIKTYENADKSGKRYQRINLVGDYISTAGDIVNSFPPAAIPLKLLGQSIPIITNLLKSRSLVKYSQAFGNYLIEDEKALLLLQQTYQSVVASQDSKGKVNSILTNLLKFNQEQFSQHSVLEVSKLKKEEKLTFDKMSQAIELLTSHFKEFTKELRQETNQYAEKMEEAFMGANGELLQTELTELLEKLSSKENSFNTPEQIDLQKQITDKKICLKELVTSVKDKLKSNNILPGAKQARMEKLESFFKNFPTIPEEIIKELEDIKHGLSKKLTEKEIKDLCQIQTELTKLQTELENLQEQQTHIEFSPKENN